MSPIPQPQMCGSIPAKRPAHLDDQRGLDLSAEDQARIDAATDLAERACRLKHAIAMNLCRKAGTEGV